MGVTERKEREKQQRKELILAAGEHLILSKGLENTTMDDIAHECELSKGTLYLYFKNKEEIFLSISVKSMVVLRDLLKSRLIDTLNPVDMIRTIGKCYLEFFQNHKNYFKFMNLLVDHKAFHSNDGTVIRELISLEEEVWGIFVTTLQKGVDYGAFKPGTKPFEVALLLWSASNGIIQLLEHFQMHNEAGDLLKQAAPDKALFISQFESVNYEQLLFQSWEMIFSAICLNQKSES